MLNADLQALARRWGASDVPFSHAVDAWVDAPELVHLRRQLDHAAALRTPILLSGPNGVGKSALVGRWMRGLETRIHLPLALTHATLSGSSVLSCLVQRLGKAPGFRRETNLARIEQALGELEHRSLVLILDEAQNYSAASLEEVRLLLGLNLPERPLFALILIGDDYLLSSLRLRHQRALFSRLGGHFRLKPWPRAQLTQYLQTSLRTVGLSPAVLPPPAAELLAAASGGFPRTLQLLARAAWLAAALAERNEISPEDVRSAIDQVPCVPGLEAPEPIAEHEPAHAG